jgi:hypothetical protein
MAYCLASAVLGFDLVKVLPTLAVLLADLTP